MRGNDDGGRLRATRPRRRLVVLLSLLALIAAPSLGIVGTTAGAAPRVKPTPIEKVQVNRFQGLRFGPDPSLNASDTGGSGSEGPLTSGASGGGRREPRPGAGPGS